MLYEDAKCILNEDTIPINFHYWTLYRLSDNPRYLRSSIFVGLDWHGDTKHVELKLYDGGACSSIENMFLELAEKGLPLIILLYALFITCEFFLLLDSRDSLEEAFPSLFL